MNKKKIKCCLLAVQKNEPFINNWIEYHINNGFAHIFIADNNEKGNELYIPEKFKSYVSIFPANSLIEHHVSRIQAKLYNIMLDYIKAINEIKEEYTHVLCLDIDEYFYYNNGNINDFIYDEMHRQDTISIPWICFSDNNIIYKKDLKTDNPIINYPIQANSDWINNEYKSIAVIHKDSVLTTHYHNNTNYNTSPKVSSKIAHIKHYRTQCLEEYIDKIRLRLCGDNPWWYDYNKNNIKLYFNYNDITNEKLDAFKYFYKKYNMEMSKEDQEFIEKHYK